jgi:hypothetical protein
VLAVVTGDGETFEVRVAEGVAVVVGVTDSVCDDTVTVSSSPPHEINRSGRSVKTRILNMRAHRY